MHTQAHTTARCPRSIKLLAGYGETTIWSGFSRKLRGPEI
jgi:hypothetical protein